MMKLDDFVCQQCGNCCKRPGFVHATHEESLAIAQFLNINIIDFIHSKTILKEGYYLLASPNFNPDCFLKNNKCDIYPVRPQACRTYPDWAGIWESEKIINEEASLCPGIKALRIHRQNEI